MLGADKFLRICVIRSVRGVEEILPLADQHHYKEWAGCFTYLGDEYYEAF